MVLHVGGIVDGENLVATIDGRDRRDQVCSG